MRNLTKKVIKIGQGPQEKIAAEIFRTTNAITMVVYNDQFDIPGTLQYLEEQPDTHNITKFTTITSFNQQQPGRAVVTREWMNEFCAQVLHNARYSSLKELEFRAWINDEVLTHFINAIPRTNI